MDQVKTGALIRALRQRENMTQSALARRLGVSDKAVSKWERGCGAPDIALLPPLAQALHVDAEALLRGELAENRRTNGNMNRLRFYICPVCGNLLFSTDDAQPRCCGKRLVPETVQAPDAENDVTVEESDGEWYVMSDHVMHREHFISFAAFLTGDTLLVRKLYPEWGMEMRLPLFREGTLLWYCTQHGLFSKQVRR